MQSAVTLTFLIKAPMLRTESRCRTQRINTMIYSLENAMEPEEFRSRVSELLNRVCPQPNNRFVKAGRARMTLALLPMLALRVMSRTFCVCRDAGGLVCRAPDRTQNRPSDCGRVRQVR